jgi:hypothetical protein
MSFLFFVCVRYCLSRFLGKGSRPGDSPDILGARVRNKPPDACMDYCSPFLQLRATRLTNYKTITVTQVHYVGCTLRIHIGNKRLVFLVYNISCNLPYISYRAVVYNM